MCFIPLRRANLRVIQMLEIYSQRIGYRPGEDVAAHSRTRYRLAPLPGALQAHNVPQVDTALWMVHYGPASQAMPVHLLPIPTQMHNIMRERGQLQKGGQIPRKEFMLADRTNWPTVHQPPAARGHPMMVQPGNTRQVPQSFAYNTPSKRSKTAAHPQQHMVPGPAAFVSFDDEEDTSAGDMFDHMTPRELSMARYTRNHEWMEEVLNSPYRIGQITPADLGLGLQGELSSVTQGIFEASGVDAHKKPPSKPVVGHLDAEQLELLRTRVADKILADQAEIARMGAQFEKQTARFKSSSSISRAGKEMRAAVEETGPEIWRLEGKEEDDEDGTHTSTVKPHRKVDEIVAEVESTLGRRIEVASDVKRIQDGGYQEPAPEPKALPVPPPAPVTESNEAGHSRPESHGGSQAGGEILRRGDVDMGGMSQTQTGPMQHTQQSSLPLNTPASASASRDVTMQDSHQAADTNTAPDQGTGSGDWIVVPKGGVSPRASAGLAPPSGGDFGDMNTAGEALNSYGQHNDGDLGDGMDLGGVEDSAFGDAVFGVEESRGSAANTPAEGI